MDSNAPHFATTRQRQLIRITPFAVVVVAVVALLAFGTHRATASGDGFVERPMDNNNNNNQTSNFGDARDTSMTTKVHDDEQQLQRQQQQPSTTGVELATDDVPNNNNKKQDDPQQHRASNSSRSSHHESKLELVGTAVLATVLVVAYVGLMVWCWRAMCGGEDDEDGDGKAGVSSKGDGAGTPTERTALRRAPNPRSYYYNGPPARSSVNTSIGSAATSVTVDAASLSSAASINTTPANVV